jgi:hypothetical protein
MGLSVLCFIGVVSSTGGGENPEIVQFLSTSWLVTAALGAPLTLAGWIAICMMAPVNRVMLAGSITAAIVLIVGAIFVYAEPFDLSPRGVLGLFGLLLLPHGLWGLLLFPVLVCAAVSVAALLIGSLRFLVLLGRRRSI